CRSAPRFAFATADASRFASTTVARGFEVETSTCRQRLPEPSGCTRQGTSQRLQVCENQRRRGWDRSYECPLLAQSRHPDTLHECRLLGVKQTCPDVRYSPKSRRCDAPPHISLAIGRPKANVFLEIKFSKTSCAMHFARPSNGSPARSIPIRYPRAD